MSSLNRIANNAIVLVIANIVKKVFAFLLILIVARSLGAEEFGKFSLAFSFVALFVIIIDFGAKILINREIARHKSEVNKYVMHTVVLKLLFTLPLIAVIGIGSTLLQYSSELKILILLATVSYVLQSLVEPFHSALRAFEKIPAHASLFIAQSILRLLLAGIVIYTNQGVATLLYSYIATDLCIGIITMVVYARKISPIRWEWDTSFARWLFRASLPFGVAAFFMTLYDKIDITMLSKMVADPNTVIGWYSASYNLIFAFEFIPISIAAAVYPYAAVLYGQGTDQILLLYEKMTKYFLLFTLPLAVGTTVLAPHIIQLLYGEGYGPSVLALQILIWGVVFRFQMYAFGVILDSMNKERVTMKATIYSCIANVILNLILIPRYSLIGAAIATVIAEGIYFIICYWTVRSTLHKAPLIRLIAKPLIASALMGMLVYALSGTFWIAVPAGILAYTLLVIFLKVIDQKDYQQFGAYLRNKRGFLRRRTF